MGLLAGLGALLFWIERNDKTEPIETQVNPEADVTQFFHWITPTLAVGSFHASVPPQCWEHFDVILNVSMKEHKGMKVEEGKVYQHLGFPDRQMDSFGEYLRESVAFVHGHQQEGRKTLVHCMSGISRSVSVVTRYLHQHQYPEATLDTVLNEVKQKRPQADPYPGFVNYLRSLPTENHEVSR